MAVFGTLLGKAVGAYGSKPKVPKLPQIDPGQVQQQTILDNSAAFNGASGLAAKVNRFNQEQQLGMLSTALERFAPGQLQQVQETNTALLRGEIPADIQQSVMRSSAGRAFAGGFAGSQFASGLGLRDLGLTSLQLQQQGMSNFGALASMLPETPLFDITSMFYTPQQRLEFAFRDRETNFNRNMLANTVKAAPDPFRAALGQAFIQDEQAIMELVGNVAGMASKGAALCWVARAVYGEANPRWKLFRHWMVYHAPLALRNFYITAGPSIAALVDRDSSARESLRNLMDAIINNMEAIYAR